MQKYDCTHSLSRFLLQRHDDSPCQLYMSYLENFQTNIGDAQIGSGCVTRFDKGVELANIKYFKWNRSGSNCLYGDKKLYDWLRKNHIIQMNLGWGATADDSEDRFKLHQAARNGSVREIEACLGMGYDINEVDSNGFSPLHLAMKEQNMECFQFLLNKGADHTIPSCDVIEMYEMYMYGGESLRDDINIEDLTLLWEAEKKVLR